MATWLLMTISFLKVVKYFLLFDNWEYDADKIFGICHRNWLNDLVKYKDWAWDRIFKCSPDIYYYLHMFHILIRNSSSTQIFILLPGTSKETYNRYFYILRNLNSESLMIDCDKWSIITFCKIQSNKAITMNLKTF